METTKETGLQLLKNDLQTLTQLVMVNMPNGSNFEEAQRIALKELSNCEMIMQNNSALSGCTPKSFVLAVKQCICDGLTLAPSAGLVYLVPGQVKVGQNGNQDIYEWVVTYDPTANGRLSIAFQSGSILDVKRPEFEFDENEVLKTVSVEFLVPSHPEPRWEKVTFGKAHFAKWMAASAKKNKGAANANYTSFNGGIDPEFAGTKAIRHGLNKRGTNLNGKRFSVPANKLIDASANFAEAVEEHGEVESETHDAVYVTTHEIINTNPEDLA